MANECPQLTSPRSDKARIRREPMQNHRTLQAAQSDESDSPDGAFDVRFRNLLAQMSEQDAAVESLLAAQGLNNDDLERVEALPDEVAAQLDDAADARMQEHARANLRPLGHDLSRYALRA